MAYLAVIGTAAKVPMRTREKERNKTMNIVRDFQNWRRYRNTVNELNGLSTRVLDDLGIQRANIRSVARKAI